MKKILSILLSIIFLNSQIYSFPTKQISVLLPNNNSAINNSVSLSCLLPADSSSSVIPAEQLGGNLSEINTTQSLLGLNRNILNTQELTKDEATRALNIDTTIDLRWLTTSGRKEIINDLKKAPKNLNQIGKNITKNNVIVQSVKNAITDEDINIIEAVKDYIKTDKQIRKIQSDKETTETLNGATNYSVEEVKGALQEVADVIISDELLDGSNAEVTVYNNESGIGSKGYSYIGKDGTEIGLNTETTDITNSGDIINTIYHEATHINKGTSEKTATNYGNTAQSIWEMYNFGNENTNIITGEQWNEKNRTEIGFIEGNNIAITNYTNSKLGFGIFNERWIYSQKYGNTYYKNEETGEIKKIATGYAGKGTGVNNPDMQHVGTNNMKDEKGETIENKENLGPLPEGTYTIGKPYYHKGKGGKGGLGPHTMNLTPDENNEMYGRNLFRIHGDNDFQNNSASEGCIILGPEYRKKISSSGDNVLEVKRGDGLIDTQYTIVGANRLDVTNYIDSKGGLYTDKYVYNVSSPLDYRKETTYISPGLKRPNTQNLGDSVYVPTGINTAVELYYNKSTPTLNLNSSPYANVETYLNELFKKLNDR